MDSVINNVKIYTDGACSGNPGKGAFSYVILINDIEIKNYCNGFIKTTNNRMELMAIIESIKFIKNLENINKETNIIIYSDSKYVVDSINKRWLNNWILKDFKNVKNVDLWKEYFSRSKYFSTNLSSILLTLLPVVTISLTIFLNILLINLSSSLTPASLV